VATVTEITVAVGTRKKKNVPRCIWDVYAVKRTCFASFLIAWMSWLPSHTQIWPQVNVDAFLPLLSLSSMLFDWDVAIFCC
jgi:hypothetical protein